MNRSTLALAAATALLAATPGVTQDSNYTPGTVWRTTDIKVEPGQFENYMDYLRGDWRKQMEFAKKEGVVVSYHVFAVNAARNGEPDLILAVEYKDYMPVAQQLAMEKKLNAAMATDNHKAEAASGQRTPMRKFMGGAELQELNFK